MERGQAGPPSPRVGETLDLPRAGCNLWPNIIRMPDNVEVNGYLMIAIISQHVKKI
jgi:hypothetical protein